jgi:hypothetical protein
VGIGVPLRSPVVVPFRVLRAAVLSRQVPQLRGRRWTPGPLLEGPFLGLDLPGPRGEELTRPGVYPGQSPAGGAGLVGGVVDLRAEAFL